MLVPQKGIVLEFLRKGSESPLISFAVGGMKATQYKVLDYILLQKKSGHRIFTLDHNLKWL